LQSVRMSIHLTLTLILSCSLLGLNATQSNASGPPYEPGDPACLTWVDSGDFLETRTLTNGYFCNGSITIPDGVTSIGDSAFQGVTALTNVSIPNSVTEIGAMAFLNATSLASVSMSNSVRSIGSSAFEGTTSLADFTIPNRVTSIGSSAFQGAAALSTISIPRSVETIGSFAFRDTASLHTVTFEGGSLLQTLEPGVFYDADALESIEIPRLVTSIADYAFFGANSLTTVRFLGTVPSLGNQVFLGIDAQAKALVNRSQLESFTASISGSDGYRWDSLDLEVFTYPSGDITCLIQEGTQIVNGVDCVGPITIPNNTTSLRDNAFFNAESLTSITLPGTITSIGARTFESATSLSLIRLMGAAPSVGVNAFLNVANGTIARIDQVHQSSYVLVDGLWNGLVLEVIIPPVSSTTTSGNAALERELERLQEVEKKLARESLVSLAKDSAPLTLNLFNQASIPGVTTSNFSEVAAEVAGLPIERRSQIDEILRIARKFEVVDKVASNQRIYSSMLQEVGLISQDSKHKAVITSAIRKLPASERSSYLAIKQAVDAHMAEIQSRKDRLALVLAAISSRRTG
jgi:hypothetical protein